MSGLCVTLVGQSLYCMYDYLCPHRQTVVTTVFMYSPFTLLGSEPQTGPWWLSQLCRSWCHVACCWLRWTFIFVHCFFWMAIHGNVSPAFLAPESCCRAWTRLGIFPVPCLLELPETEQLLDWLFCMAHSWLAACQSAFFVFLDSIVDWIFGVPHCIELCFDSLQQILHGLSGCVFYCSRIDSHGSILHPVKLH